MVHRGPANFATHDVNHAICRALDGTKTSDLCSAMCIAENHFCDAMHFRYDLRSCCANPLRCRPRCKTLLLRKILAPIKIKSALPPPPPNPKYPPPKTRNFVDMAFSCRRTHVFQAPIKLAQPFLTPELRRPQDRRYLGGSASLFGITWGKCQLPFLWSGLLVKRRVREMVWEEPSNSTAEQLQPLSTNAQ